jgi:hypothetical protein
MPPVNPKQKSANDFTMTLMVDGNRYPFSMSDISARMELELYRQSGLVLTKVIQEVSESPAGFHIAALVFLARISRGDEITFDEVADSMGLASEIEVMVEDELADEVDTPKALDGN